MTTAPPSYTTSGDTTAYGSALYDRLRQIKSTYEPENLFRGNLYNPPLMPDKS